jgi:hypothetical protein
VARYPHLSCQHHYRPAVSYLLFGELGGLSFVKFSGPSGSHKFRAPGAALARVDALRCSEQRFFGGDAVHG